MLSEGRLVPLLDNLVATSRLNCLEDYAPIGYEAYLFVLVEEGGADVEINNIPQCLVCSSLLMLKPYMVITSFRVNEAFAARCLWVDRDFFASVPESLRFHIMQNKIVNEGGISNVRLDNTELVEMIALFGSPCRFTPSHSLARSMMLARLSYLLLLAMVAMCREIQIADSAVSHIDVLVQNFLQLLSQHYAEQHQLGFYAQELCVSSRYLQSVVRKSTGRTARSFISEQLKIHAQRLLVDSDMTIKQIAVELHFCSLSAFGKFFRTNCAVSPRKYRAQSQIISNG